MFFLSKTTITYPIKDVQVTKKPSALTREHPALQNMKFLDFFLLFWVLFALLDPDLDYEYGSRSTDLIESGSNTGPEPYPHPQPCLVHENTSLSILRFNYLSSQRGKDRLCPRQSSVPDP